MSQRFDSREQQAYLNLWRAYDLLKALEDELFARHGLSPQQYNALRLLQQAYPQSLPVSTIGARLISRAPDMTRLLDKLEQRQLIRRERRPENRRVVEVVIAPKGQRLLDKLAEPVRDCHSHQLGHLSAEELEELTRLLKLVRLPHEELQPASIAGAAEANG